MQRLRISIREGQMIRFILLCIVCVVALVEVHAQDRSYGRSMVITDRGIVATSHYLASQAGAQIVARGGTAMDAAIAANALLGVTEPMMNGMGGDLFLLYWDANAGKLYGLNASGWAPQKLTPEFLAQHGIKTMPREGIHSVTVPGAVEEGPPALWQTSMERPFQSCHLLRRARICGP